MLAFPPYPLPPAPPYPSNSNPSCGGGPPAWLGPPADEGGHPPGLHPGKKKTEMGGWAGGGADAPGGTLAAAAGCVGRQPIERHLMRSATPRVEVCFVRIAADRATFYTHGIHERAHGSIVAATA